MKFDGLIDLAVRQARKSVSDSRHGAVCFNPINYQPISIGYNKRPLKPLKIERLRCHLHAEFCAAMKLSSKRARTVSLIVIRITASLENLTSSKPCGKCVGMLRRKGIKKIYFSTKDGLIDWMHV